MRLARRLPASYSVFSGMRSGELLTVGSGKQFSTLSLAMDYIATKTWASSGSFAGTVTAIAGSSSVTGTGFSSLTDNDYLNVGADWWAIKSIESNVAATLWHGAQANVSGSAATRYTTNPFTVEVFDNQDIPTKTIPLGINFQLIGRHGGIELNTAGAITIPYHGVVSASNFKLLNPNTNPIFVNGFSLGRAIVEVSDITVFGSVASSTALQIGCAALTLRNISGHQIRTNITCDYLNVDNVHNITWNTSDVSLVAATFGSTDKGHPYVWNNSRYIAQGQTVAGQNAAIEINAVPAGKIVNVTNSLLLSYSTQIAGSAAAQPFWSPVGGAVVTITNSKVDALANAYEVYDRTTGAGGSLTYNSTTRLNGAALRAVV